MINQIKDVTNPFLFNLEYIVDNKIVGYLKYTILYEKVEIEDLKVEPYYQRQHIASKLMDYLLNEVKDKINITLEVNVNNIKAINLYNKYGFQEVSIRKNYYGPEDGILMELKLGAK